MNPLGTRARIEELAALLEGSVSASQSPSHAALALRLRALGPVLEPLATPRADFRTALRTRLVAVATVQAAAAADAPFAAPLPRSQPLEALASWVQSAKAQRRIGVTAGAMAGVIAFTGVGMAASRSLPGEAFYGVKRGAEAVQLQFTSGDQARGAKHLEFAATRLREVKALADGDSEIALGAPTAPLAAGVAFGGSLQSKINHTLNDFNSETTSGRTLLEKVYGQTGKQEPLRILQSFSVQQQTTLAALLPRLPEASKAVAQQSLALVTEVQTTSTDQLALGICGGECFPGNSGPPLPAEPSPSPGVTASPDNNGVPDCACGPTPSAEPTPTSEPSATPTSEPTDSPKPTPSPTSKPTSKPTSSPSPLPVPLPTVVPTSLPTILPTLLPGTIPTLPPLQESAPVPQLATAPRP